MNMDEWAAKNKALAEVLGWRDIEEDEWWEETRDSGPYLCKALMGTSPHGDKERLLPDFYGSVDATLAELPDTFEVGLTNEYEGDDDNGQVVHRALIHRRGLSAWVQTFAGTGATRAEALANALLAWAQAQPGGAK